MSEHTTAASLCDTCMKPGACCSGFPLGNLIMQSGTEEEVDKALGDIVTGTNAALTDSYVFGYGGKEFLRAMEAGRTKVQIGLPFKRAGKGADGTWRFACPKLGDDGRCTIYEERPAVCRQFVPGSAKPCCHYTFGIGICSERATGIPFERPVTQYERGVAAADPANRRPLIVQEGEVYAKA